MSLVLVITCNGSSNVHDVGTSRKMEESPRASRRAGVLTGHKEGNHNVCSFPLGKLATVLVALVGQRRKHVLFVLRPNIDSSKLSINDESK